MCCTGTVAATSTSCFVNSGICGAGSAGKGCRRYPSALQMRWGVALKWRVFYQKWFRLGVVPWRLLELSNELLKALNVDDLLDNLNEYLLVPMSNYSSAAVELHLLKHISELLVWLPAQINVGVLIIMEQWLRLILEIEAFCEAYGDGSRQFQAVLGDDVQIAGGKLLRS